MRSDGMEMTVAEESKEQRKQMKLEKSKRSNEE